MRIALMEETFRASDAIDDRRRITYDRASRVFRRHYDIIAASAGAARARSEAELAFGSLSQEPLGSFEDSVQLMLGGDELFAAAHPLYAAHVCRIVAELTREKLDEDRTIDVRVGVSFTTAIAKDPSTKRENIQLAHQEAMKLADESHGLLKPLERTQRRIERLIDVLEANPRKSPQAPKFRQSLGRLRLMELYVRVKFARPGRLPPGDFQALRTAMRRGDLSGAATLKLVQLVDFNCTVVDPKKLVSDATALENQVRRLVGGDNARYQLPSDLRENSLMKWMIKKIRKWADQDKSAGQTWVTQRSRPQARDYPIA